MTAQVKGDYHISRHNTRSSYLCLFLQLHHERFEWSLFSSSDEEEAVVIDFLADPFCNELIFVCWNRLFEASEKTFPASSVMTFASPVRTCRGVKEKRDGKEGGEEDEVLVEEDAVIVEEDGDDEDEARAGTIITCCRLEGAKSRSGFGIAMRGRFAAADDPSSLADDGSVAAEEVVAVVLTGASSSSSSLLA